MMLPHVGRMDDIWASYFVQEKFPNSVIYNTPSVYQERNEHDIVLDLEREVIGYRNTLKLLKKQYSLPSEVAQAYEAYQKAFVN